MRRWSAISLFSAAALLFGGCAATPTGAPTTMTAGAAGAEASEAATGAAASEAAAFRVFALVTIRPRQGAAERFRILWERTTDGDGQDDIRAQSPLGDTLARLTRNATMTTMEADGKTFSDRNADALSARLLGYAVPVEALGHWLVGNAAPGAPATVTRDLRGGIAGITQHDWRIAYLRRDENGRPRQLSLFAPTAEISVVVKKWLTPTP